MVCRHSGLTYLFFKQTKARRICFILCLFLITIKKRLCVLPSNMEYRIKCRNCGKVTTSRTKYKLYCSIECAREYRRNLKYRNGYVGKLTKSKFIVYAKICRKCMKSFLTKKKCVGYCDECRSKKSKDKKKMEETRVKRWSW